MSTETTQKTVVYPLVDVFESDKEFMLVADLPGVPKEDLDITVEGGQLELRAETESLEYRRSFALGDDVDLDAVEAKLERGELKVHLPKRAEAQVRKIAIKG
ncbi:MAG: Hsp20/alpha crystallin family protein [Enhygromyxa sp.]